MKQVQAECLNGHETVGTIKGSLKILNESDTRFWGPTKLEREYTVVFEDDGYAVQGAEVSRLNMEGDAVWSICTDIFGEARFSLTYYTYWKGEQFYQYHNNITATRLLVTEKDGVRLNATVSLTTTTPIILSHP